MRAELVKFSGKFSYFYYSFIFNKTQTGNIPKHLNGYIESASWTFLYGEEKNQEAGEEYQNWFPISKWGREDKNFMVPSILHPVISSW